LGTATGTTNLTLKKMKKPDPLIDAKLKSKKHLQNIFFDLLSGF
jgi:hypothetical protein